MCCLGGMSSSDAVSMSFFSLIAINICLGGRVVYSAGRKCNGMVEQLMIWGAFFVWLTGRRGGGRGSGDWFTFLPTCLPFASTSRKHERIRSSRGCASDPEHSTPHQSNYCCNQRCMLRTGLCAALILSDEFRQRTFLRVSSSFWKSFGRT